MTFYEPLAAIHEHHHATTRLIHFVERESMRLTFAGVAEEVGIDEKTVRSMCSSALHRAKRSRICCVAAKV